MQITKLCLQLLLPIIHDRRDSITTQTSVPIRAVMNAFPMLVLPLNNLVTTKIIIVEITRPITKMTAGLSNSNDAIKIYIVVKRINSCIEILIV